MSKRSRVDDDGGDGASENDSDRQRAPNNGDACECIHCLLCPVIDRKVASLLKRDLRSPLDLLRKPVVPI